MYCPAFISNISVVVIYIIYSQFCDIVVGRLEEHSASQTLRSSYIQRFSAIPLAPPANLQMAVKYTRVKWWFVWMRQNVPAPDRHWAWSRRRCFCRGVRCSSRWLRLRRHSAAPSTAVWCSWHCYQRRPVPLVPPAQLHTVTSLDITLDLPTPYARSTWTCTQNYTRMSLITVTK